MKNRPIIFKFLTILINLSNVLKLILNTVYNINFEQNDKIRKTSQNLTLKSQNALMKLVKQIIKKITILY